MSMRTLNGKMQQQYAMMLTEVEKFLIEYGNKEMPRSKLFRAGMWLEIYVRVGPCAFYARRRWNALALARIDIAEKYRNKGILSQLLIDLAKLGKQHAQELIQVENIGNPLLIDALARREFTNWRYEDTLDADDHNFPTYAKRL